MLLQCIGAGHKEDSRPNNNGRNNKMNSDMISVPDLYVNISFNIASFV